MSEDLVITGKALPLTEEFYSIQGEGFHTGKASYFIRLGGCDIGCSWCDSKYSWDSKHSELTETKEIIRNIKESKATGVVVTGGEPLLYNLDFLCNCLKEKKITTFLETSGAYKMTGEWDWICLSPKIRKPPLDNNYILADELKVIIKEKKDLSWAEENAQRVKPECHLYLQPEWSQRKNILPEIIKYILNQPKWKISLQTHKYMGIQ